MRFPEFLRATTLCSAASATLLAVLTFAAVNSSGDKSAAYVGVAWWAIAAVTGTSVGRRRSTSPQIATLLSGARTQAGLPELNPSRTLINRLWPLFVLTVIAGAVSFKLPQVAAIGSGFAIIWALSWRHQSAAVTAIEERDGARFYVEKTTPWRAMKLVRTPGFRATMVEEYNTASSTNGGAGNGSSGPISVIKRRMTR